MIYAIEILTPERFIKFGRALDGEKRLANLQSSTPYELRLLALANWPDGEEGRIHAFLIRSHVRGEWYRPGPDTDYVIAIMVADDGLALWQAQAPGILVDKIPHEPRITIPPTIDQLKPWVK